MTQTPLEVQVARLEVQVSALQRAMTELAPIVQTMSTWAAEHRGTEIGRLANGKRVDVSLSDHTRKLETIEKTTEANAVSIRWLTRASWAENVIIIGMLLKLFFFS